MGSESGIACSLKLNTSLDEQQRAAFQNSDTIQRILSECRTVAVVGLSTNRQRASYFVASYLQAYGYRVIPVNPGADRILGEPCYRTLLEVPGKVDLVNVFRPASDCPGIADQAIRIGARGLWLQLRIISLEAAQKAMDAGLAVVVDRCVKMEHGRFSGGLHEAGMNTEIVTAKRQRGIEAPFGHFRG